MPRTIGLRHAARTVYIYLLDEEEALRIEDPHGLLALLKAVRDTYYEGLALDAAEWCVRSGPLESAVALKPTAATAVEMTLTNPTACRAPPATLDDYQADRFREFNPVLVRRPPLPEPETYFSQQTPDGKTYLFKHASPSAAERNAVVYVDAQKLIALLREHAPEQVPRPEELSRQPAPDWSADLQTLLKLSCVSTANGLSFGISSGRVDLLAAMLRSGAERIPVAVDHEQAALLARLCGPSNADRAPPSRQNRPPAP